MANFNEGRAFGHSDVIGSDTHRTHLLRGAIVAAKRHCRDSISPPAFRCRSLCETGSGQLPGRDGETGRRSGLKIRRAQKACGGSIPPPGTTHTRINTEHLDNSHLLGFGLRLLHFASFMPEIMPKADFMLKLARGLAKIPQTFRGSKENFEN